MSEPSPGLLHKSSRIFAVPDRLAAAVFFALLLACGLLIYRDYGISWDEPTQLRIGVANYRYVTKGDPALLSLRDRYYGPLFEMLLVRFQSRGNDQQVYYSRHLLNFLCFYAGCLAFYFLARRFLRSDSGGQSPHCEVGGWAALAGTGFLALSPRIFADAFYNSKDIPFMVFSIFGLLSMLWFLDRPGLPRLALHALFSAALIDVRLPGLVLPALTLAGLALEVLAHRVTLRRGLVLSPLYLAITAGAGLLAWPALWPNPLDGFAQAWQMMSHFPHETSMLYMGQTITTLNVPWHYIPVWLAITTPPLYLALFFIGLGVMLASLARVTRRGVSRQARDSLLVLGAFFIPMLAVIVMKSVVYDAWRQMFFIYPPLLLAASYGLLWGWKALEKRLGRRLAAGLGSAALALGLLPTLVWMAANHPFQNLYFNRLAGPDMATIQQRYELDYWGLAYRKGLEYLVQAQKAGPIQVFIETAAGRSSIAILPPDEAVRVKVKDDFLDAEYYIGNYYLHPAPYPLENEIFSVRVGNAKILSVFHLQTDPFNQKKTN